MKPKPKPKEDGWSAVGGSSFVYKFSWVTEMDLGKGKKEGAFPSKSSSTRGRWKSIYQANTVSSSVAWSRMNCRERVHRKGAVDPPRLVRDYDHFRTPKTFSTIWWKSVWQRISCMPPLDLRVSAAIRSKPQILFIMHCKPMIISRVA